MAEGRSSSNRKQRLSISGSPDEGSQAAELLSLCQTVTQDGSLSNDEILSLRKWLLENRESDLPATTFLLSIVERIVADRKVTREERKELYKALEAVLPPDLRKLAAIQRRLTEVEEKAHARLTREATKRAEKEEKARHRPIWSINFMVAGVRYEGRPRIIQEHVQAGCKVFLARDPQNMFSKNAIEIRLANGMQIGFVPEEDAVETAPFLDEGYPHSAYVTKVLTSGSSPIPVIQADIYRGDAGLGGLVLPAQVPEKVNQAANSHDGRFKAVFIPAVVVISIIITVVVCVARGCR